MPSTASTVETETTTGIGLSRLATYGLLAAIAATLTNAIVGVVARTVFDVPAGFGGLGWGPIIGFSALAGVVATGVYALVVRSSTQPNRTFTIVAAVVLVLSYVPFTRPPEGLAGASQSVFVTMGVMHVTAAVAIVGVLRRAPNQDEESP